MIALNYFKSIKLTVVLLTLSFLTLGFVCTGMVNHASIHDPLVSVTTTIPADGQQCCNSGISKHIESWKGSLLALPREIKDGLLLLLGLATAFVLMGLCFNQNPNDPQKFQYKFYIRDNPELSLFNQLKLAFARGILNPKIY